MLICAHRHVLFSYIFPFDDIIPINAPPYFVILTIFLQFYGDNCVLLEGHFTNISELRLVIHVPATWMSNNTQTFNANIMFVFMSLSQRWIDSSKSSYNHINFCKIKWHWKCRLQNGSHLCLDGVNVFRMTWPHIYVLLHRFLMVPG